MKYFVMYDFQRTGREVENRTVEYDTLEDALDEVRHAKMHPAVRDLRLFEATEVNIDDVPPMTREEM